MPPRGAGPTKAPTSAQAAAQVAFRTWLRLAISAAEVAEFLCKGLGSTHPAQRGRFVDLRGNSMIPDFDALKKQLSELAEVVNRFKSEAVQLRVVELVLTGEVTTGNEKEKESHSTTRSPQRRRWASSKESSGKKTKGKTSKQPVSRSGKPGGAAMLTRLIGEGFFKKPKTITSVVDYCDTKLGFKYGQSLFSGPLVRAIRDDKLNRAKNKDGQYEYSDPS